MTSDDPNNGCEGDYAAGVPEVFLACGGNFRCRPKADTSSALGREIKETGNRARKVSGTQGTNGRI